MIIIGIVAAIAMPRFAQATSRQQLDAAAKRLIADFALARTRANAASQTLTLTFDPDTGTYIMDAVGGDALTVDLSQSPYGVKISGAAFSGNRYAQFNAFGVPLSTGKVTLANASGSVTIVLKDNGQATR